VQQCGLVSWRLLIQKTIKLQWEGLVERWERIERFALWVGTAVVLAYWGWLAFTGDFLWLGFLFAVAAPFIFWMYWQVFFDHKLGSAEPPSRAERVMYTGWVLVRRLVVGGFAAILTVAAIVVFQKGYWLGSAGAAAAAACFGWGAFFGMGRSSSLSDDRPVHRARARRYRR